MRKLLGQIVIVTLILMLGLFATAQPTTIVWSFWGDPGELPPNYQVIEAFEAAHPDIKVEVQHAPWGSYFDRIQTQMAGGTAPDVMFLNNIPSYASRGVLAPLDELIQRDNFAIEAYHPELMRIFSYDGNIYGFPRDNDTTVLYFNKDLFDEAGISYPTADWTWDDLRQAAAALTKQDARGRTVQYGLGLEKNKYPVWVYQNGGQVFDDPVAATTFLMDEPAAVEAIQFVADMINEDGSVPSFDAMQQLGSTTELFSTGRVAMVMTNAARVPTFSEAAFEWDIAPLPAGPTGIRANTLGGAGYVISATSNNQEAAWTFLKFLAGPEGQSIFAGTGLAVPAFISDETASAFAQALPETINGAVFIEETANGQLFPVFPGWREIESTIVIPMLDLVWNGELSAEEAIARMAPQVEEALARQ
jgi:multiple sugar transport system substrate-binding protein